MTSWIPDLSGASAPLYLAIANALGEAIETRELPQGVKLPTHRQLALSLGVSVQTVSAAYREAERRGLVVGETGRGTFVRGNGQILESQFIMPRRHEHLIDLSINRPASGFVHAEAVHAVFGALAESMDLASMTACRPVQGLDQHRVAAVEWLTRRSVQAAVDQVVICNGAAHGLLLALATVADPGDTVVTDELTDHGAILLASTLHLRLKPLPCDEQGILPDGFAAACAAGDVRALFTIPTLNNPTCTVMPLERRRALAAIARRHGVAIVEDDPYSMLLENPPPALSSFAPELSYYVTTFTKSLMPGVRTGYLVGPPAQVPRIVSRLRATSWMATPLVAEIASQWLSDGTADRLIQWQRDEMTARQKILQRALRGFRYRCQRHALHAWLTISEQWRVEAFVASLRQRNVAVTPAEVFMVGRGNEPHAVRLSLGATRSRAQFEQGLTVIAELLRRDPEPLLAEA
ncbi:MAG: PLP-dependent aminotransferase family protein [Tistlia sp.]|uniref:MocR-like ectoine utilization transcription factor EhuR n=1 Tax=Tistlia sp. TaxID=3057121 RepID=UPI0034A390DD